MAIEDFSLDFEVDEELATPVGAPSEDTGELIIYDNELSNFRVIGEISRLIKGTFKGNGALLVVFKFTFHANSGNRIFRFKSADLRLKGFDKQSSIRRYTPSVAIGEEKEAQIKWNCGLKLGIDGAGAGVPLTVEPEMAREKSYSKVERMKIVAMCTGPKGTGIYNQIRWAITEQADQDRGIPPIFRCAFIIETASEAALRFQLQVEADVGLHLQALWAALRAKPTVVNVDPAKAEQAPTLDGKLDEIDLAAEAPLPDHF